MNRSVSFILILAFLAAIAASSVIAGDLNPPTGPVAPAMKPLTDIEPRIALNATNTPGDNDSILRISQPGSYYLTRNVAGEAGKSGIEIAADGVTVDLMGFDLVGVPGSKDGVRVSIIGADNIEIRNGGVRFWGENGINTSSPGSAIGARIVDIRAYRNGLRGIRVASHTLISGCTSYNNFDHGFSTAQAATVVNCSAGENVGDGFVIEEGSTITACNSYDNDSRGIRCSFDSTVTGCTLNRNSTGIEGGSVIIGCTIVSSTFSGIVAQRGTTITNCTLRSNGNHGISAADGCSISGCTVLLNTFDGIVASSDCRITGNTCTGNGRSGGAGIHVTGSDNHIEGNTCTDATRGIDVDAAGNFIARNTASGNSTNYAITGTQTIGPIVSTTGVITNSNPWANFEF